jgi:hypothetical protein
VNSTTLAPKHEFTSLAKFLSTRELAVDLRFTFSALTECDNARKKSQAWQEPVAVQARTCGRPQQMATRDLDPELLLVFALCREESQS